MNDFLRLIEHCLAAREARAKIIAAEGEQKASRSLKVRNCIEPKKQKNHQKIFEKRKRPM